MNYLNKKMYLHLQKILEKYNIPFWIDGLTLLNFYKRENGYNSKKNSQILRLSISGENFDAILSLLKNFNYFYRYYLVPNKSGRDWINIKYCRIVLIYRWRKKKNSFKILITPKFKINASFCWVDYRSCKKVSDEFYKSLNVLSIDSMNIPIPCKTDKYLQTRFGEKWHSPDLQWIGSIDDRAILNDEELRNVPITRIQKTNNIKKIKLKEGNNHQKMKSMLMRTIDILNDIGLKYWLDAGTLLGIIRDGDLIPWDYDADIGILPETSHEIMKHRIKFLPKYSIYRRKVNSIWLPENTRVLKVKTVLERIKQINFHLDLFCVYPLYDTYRWIDSDSLKHADKKYFDKLDTITWEGREIKIPNHVEEYLSFRYGDWKTPNENYDASIHDGAIAEKGF